MKKKIFITILLTMFCTLASCQCVNAETEIKTTIQIKNGASSWINISASDAYDKCWELNDDNSALGTTGDNVMAHLATNADWFAVGVLTYSAYGSKSNNTTGNNSGIILTNKHCFSAGIVEEYMDSDTTYYQSILDNKDTKFVEKLETMENKENNRPGLGFLSSEFITFVGSQYVRIGKGPISCRGGYYGTLWYAVGNANPTQTGNSGAPCSVATFRPVIWVK